jgi:hypothetical protein
MEGKITISRDSNDRIGIQIHDEASGIRFVEFKMSLEAFAQAITGLARVSGELQLRGLENVGKRLEIQRREAMCPDLGFDKQRYLTWLAENAAEPGWEIDYYLGSQGSIARNGDAVTLNYTVRRYLPVENRRTPDGGKA